jgi:23S rRNA (cytosine1962-C5)-methyltransferase
MNEAQITLKPGKEKPVLRFHPWIFSGAIASLSRKVEEGDLVTVCDSAGRFLGRGHAQQGSISVRILSFEDIPIDDHFWNQKMALAFKHRRIMGFPDSTTNCFRLVHGEGDGLPGLIVDVYGQVAVVQCHSVGMYLARTQIAEAILNTSGGIVDAVFDKSAESLGTSDGNGFLAGSSAPAEVLENGHRFKIDFEQGQKTGFFIDQRDNRALLARYSAGKKVLNTFCYTGGFSVYALKAGASLVHSVDSSKKAIDMAVVNAELNPGYQGVHEAFTADVPEWLKTCQEKYDIIILDPPAFAKHQDARHRAVQAYKRLNLAALKAINSGGILFTFSCSQVVDRDLFRHTITAACIESGRKISVLHQLTQPADHPVSIYHPEGEYLKGLVLLIH